MTLMRKARFRLSLWIWARLLPFLVRNRDLSSVVALAQVGPGIPYAGLAPGYIVRRVRRATRRPRLMRNRPCLRQGLLAMRFLHLAGYRPVLHFGVDRTSAASDVLSAHCWVTLSGEVVLNPGAPSLVEILSFRDGRLLPSSPGKATVAFA